MALRRPPPRAAEVHRAVSGIAAERGWLPVSYPVVRRTIAGLDRGLLALAHGGALEYRDNFELVMRRVAADPNDIWQADHTELDLMVLGEKGAPDRARDSVMPESLMDSRTLMYTRELTITARRLNLEVGLHVDRLSSHIERTLNPGYDHEFDNETDCRPN